MQREWEFTVSNAGNMPGQVSRELADLVRGLPGKKLRLKLTQYQKKRSNDANRYYWGVVVKAITAFFREHGNYVDEHDTHEFLKMRVGKLAQVIVLPDGEVVKGLGSTAKLTTAEFADYIARVTAWAAEYGCVIPQNEEEVSAITNEREIE